MLSTARTLIFSILLASASKCFRTNLKLYNLSLRLDEFDARAVDAVASVLAIDFDMVTPKFYKFSQKS